MILLDTHVLLWQERGDRRLGREAGLLFKEALRTGDWAVSAISFWEIGMRIQKGHLELRVDLAAWRTDLLGQGMIELPIDGAVAARAALLPRLHGDPADRLIVATALEGHRLMTADRLILDWSGPMSRVDATK